MQGNRYMTGTAEPGIYRPDPQGALDGEYTAIPMALPRRRQRPGHPGRRREAVQAVHETGGYGGDTACG